MSGLAITDESSVYIYEQALADWGETAPDSPTLLTWRIRSEDGKQNTTREEDDEIDPTAQVVSNRRVAIEAAATVATRCYYPEADKAEELALKNLFRSAGWSDGETVTATDISFANSTAKILQTAAGLVGFLTGDVIRVRGAGAGTNAGKLFVVTTGATAAEMVVSPAPADQSAGGSVTIEHAGGIWNGVACAGIGYEKVIEGDATEFQFITGLQMNTLGLTARPGQSLEMQWGMMGAQLLNPGATVGDGSPTAAATGAKMIGAEMNTRRISGVDSALRWTDLSLNFNSGLRKRDGLGSLPPSNPYGLSKFKVDGSVGLHFQDSTQLDLYLADTQISLLTSFKDPNEGEIGIYLPVLDITDVPVVIQGTNNDVIATVTFMAAKHATYGTARLFRFAPTS